MTVVKDHQTTVICSFLPSFVARVVGMSVLSMAARLPQIQQNNTYANKNRLKEPFEGSRKTSTFTKEDPSLGEEKR